MKKLLAFVALAVSMVLVLAACNGGAADGDSSSSAGNTPAPVVASEDETGAEDAFAENISIVAREDGSGTKTAFMELIGLKDKADPAGVIIQTGTAGVLAEVQGNPAAIAYESLGYVTADVKALQVDGTDATTANIQSGTYKISRPLSVVYHEASLDDAVNQAFFTYLQSSDAQTIIAENGYVTSTDGAPAAYTMDGALSGSIDVSGSTSLQPLMIELAAAFEALQTNVTVSVSGGGSGTGYQNAEDGVSAFGMISEEFATEKAPSCTHYIVCKDGIAIIVNSANPITNITMDQLKNIYDVDAGANAITNWSALTAQ